MKWRLSFTFSLLLPLSFSVLSSSALSDEGVKWNASLSCAVASLLKLSSFAFVSSSDGTLSETPFFIVPAKLLSVSEKPLYLIHDLSDIECPVYGKDEVN